jgi:SAM-dependent methyltransferase
MNDSPWIRCVMDQSTRELVGGISPENLAVCEVSGEKWKNEFSWKSYLSLEYPVFDVCENKFPSTFDLIVVEQVFEHVRYPARAASNIYGALSNGGHFLITVPFIFHIHPTPLDCWRWTPQGLSFMLQDAGFDENSIVVGAWGNYECFLRHAIEQTAPAMHNQFSLVNVAHVPNMVWALARKDDINS